jgi:prepilin-type N-terminal cleavage/methylation domain-containing protein
MKGARSGPRRSKALGRGLPPLFHLTNSIFLLGRFLSGSTARKFREHVGSRNFQAAKSGFTLLEMTVVIAVILVLVGAASLGVKPYYAFRDGRAAGEMLRSVKAAQLLYLADNPSVPVSSLTFDSSATGILPYMPNGTAPTLPSVGAQVPTINCAVFPPVAVLGGTTYDPSGSTTDGLWDVGQY